MNVLDLRSVRCPLALVTLKCRLLSEDNLALQPLSLVFSSEVAMKDIKQYLDKKAYQYDVIHNDNDFVIQVFSMPIHEEK